METGKQGTKIGIGKLKVGIIGTGNMGGAIATCLLRHPSRFEVKGTRSKATSAKETEKNLGFPCSTNNVELTSSCDVLILAVKPQKTAQVMREIKSRVKDRSLFISIAAGITTEDLAKQLPKNVSIVRAMPNTPALVGAGMSALAARANCTKEHLEIAKEIFLTMGKVTALDESHLDAVTGLSGCGPAYVYLMIEALAEGGVKVGLPRGIATLLSAQTLLGAAKMVLDRDVHPASLKDEVTTPAGCAIEGLHALEEGKLRVTLVKAVIAATKRSRELSSKLK